MFQMKGQLISKANFHAKWRHFIPAIQKKIPSTSPHFYENSGLLISKIPDLGI